MRHFSAHWMCALAVVTSSTLLALCCSSAAAFQADSPTKSARGGMLARASEHEFEVFFYPTGLRLFAHRAGGRSAVTNQSAATVTFYHPNSPAPWFTRSLHGGDGSLDLSMNLSSLSSSGVRARFEVKGLDGPGGAEATFTVPMEFVANLPGESGPTVTRTSFYGPPANNDPQPSVAPVATESLNYSAPPPQYAGTPAQAYVPAAPWTYGVTPVPSYVPAVPTYVPETPMIYSGHYHIRDWTTGIEKPSYAVSKPWLDVRQYP